MTQHALTRQTRGTPTWGAPIRHRGPTLMQRTGCAAGFVTAGFVTAGFVLVHEQTLA